MTTERARLLGELLDEMAQDLRGFIPTEAWYAVQRAFALSYIELAIVRHNPVSRRVEILLAHRSDEVWNGWHIPGGIWRTRQTRDECVASIIQSEDLKGDSDVKFLAQGVWEKWHDHPYGTPVVHSVILRGENITETQTRRWFDSVPEGIINDGGHHARYIVDILKQAERLL